MWHCSHCKVISCMWSMVSCACIPTANVPYLPEEGQEVVVRDGHVVRTAL